MASLSTLCYLERDGKYLMLHRTRKKKDVNKDKWIGVGGHFEKDESPEECLLREVREETGYTLTSYHFRGLVTSMGGQKGYSQAESMGGRSDLFPFAGGKTGFFLPEAGL